MTTLKSNINHVLLTGLPGVGKTTLVCKICDILKEKQLHVIGFYTKELRNEAKLRIGFDVITLDGKIRKLARTSDSLLPNESTKHRVGNYVVFVNEFESLALPMLRAMPENAIVILDEIGKMEMFSQAFVKTVSELFNRPNIRILATIPVQRGRPLPLVEQLRNDPANHVIAVDRTNRNNLTNEILRLLKVR